MVPHPNDCAAEFQVPRPGGPEGFQDVLLVHPPPKATPGPGPSPMPAGKGGGGGPPGPGGRPGQGPPLGVRGQPGALQQVASAEDLDAIEARVLAKQKAAAKRWLGKARSKWVPGDALLLPVFGELFWKGCVLRGMGGSGVIAEGKLNRACCPRWACLAHLLGVTRQMHLLT